ncbi:MAG: gamma-glutamyl-gamma-aminobutyrate hydrolase family protein [Gemmataceae bacterium]|nr:gamma-glutamyl-gamma-aminobutyrate hydrolase family protein [Gemmata sp.]MDW8197813.1 gamma-glutamyl-gamma-aminobutyrate hydrolase family protein [Gemmataceae bacterium]
MPARAKDSKIKEKTPAPQASRPFIAINADLVMPKNGTPFAKLNLGYIDAIMAAGGFPIILPPLRKENLPEIDLLLNQCAGIILTGGADMDPRRNGQSLTAAVNPMPARREDADRYLLSKIFERKMPVLGIGLGMQQINVFAGGTLFLHLPTDNPKAMMHYDQMGAPHRHMVLVEPGTRLDDIYGAQELRVNSMHHQAINQLGKRLRVAAKAPDGVIEAIESTDPNWFCVGVQWHPEAETASALDVQIFDCFVQAAVRNLDSALVAA